jgi:peptidoglycan hydrolase CwlO-like protein
MQAQTHKKKLKADKRALKKQTSRLRDLTASTRSHIRRNSSEMAAELMAEAEQKKTQEHDANRHLASDSGDSSGSSGSSGSGSDSDSGSYTDSDAGYLPRTHVHVA